MRGFLFVFLFFTQSVQAQWYVDLNTIYYYQSNEVEPKEMLVMMDDSILLDKYVVHSLSLAEWSYSTIDVYGIQRPDRHLMGSYSELNSEWHKFFHVTSFHLLHFKRGELQKEMHIEGNSLSVDEIEYCKWNMRKGDSVVVKNISLEFPENQKVKTNFVLSYIIQRDLNIDYMRLKQTYEDVIDEVFDLKEVDVLFNKYCNSSLIGNFCSFEMCEIDNQFIIEFYFNSSSRNFMFVTDTETKGIELIDVFQNERMGLDTWRQNYQGNSNND